MRPTEEERAVPELQVATVPVTPFQQNCALIWDSATQRGAVIDPGGEVERILAAIARVGLSVETILLTHGHLDHAGGAAALQRALRRQSGDETAAPIVGPDRRDAFLLEGIARQAAAYGLDGMENATPDRFLSAGETVTIGGHAFAVIHCPGHTPGHVVFFSAEARFAVVGDVLFRGSIGRTDFPYGDHAALIGAITHELLPLGDDVAFLCGHGPGSTFGEERRSNPFLR